MAKGKHPVPFRPRKLSSSAPMVLRGGPRGRVGRRRTYFRWGRPRAWGRPQRFCAAMTLVLRSWRAARLLATEWFYRHGGREAGLEEERGRGASGDGGGRSWPARQVVPVVWRAPGRRAPGRGRAVLSGKAGRPGRLAGPGPAVSGSPAPQRAGRRPAQVTRPAGRVRDRAADAVGPKPHQAPLGAGPGANSIRTGTVESRPVGQEAVRPGRAAHPGPARHGRPEPPGPEPPGPEPPGPEPPGLVRRGLVRRGLV